jgi:hypothetical protein
MADRFAASLSPATNASTRRRARFPHTSDTTLARVMLVFQHLVDPILGLGARLPQGDPCTRQVASGPHLGRRYTTRLDQPMRQQLRNPCGITLVGLCARPLPDILALGHTHLDRFTPDRIDWLPGDARPLHGHHRTPLLVQPDAKSDQGTVGGTTIDQLCGALAIVTDPTQTGHQLRRMHLDTATDRVEHWHGASLLHVG